MIYNRYIPVTNNIIPMYIYNMYNIYRETGRVHLRNLDLLYAVLR